VQTVEVEIEWPGDNRPRRPEQSVVGDPYESIVGAWKVVEPVKVKP
jgi:hypothetical protein